MFNYEKLRQGNEEILNNRYRVRLLKKSSVPIVCDIPGFEDDVLVIDLPEAEGLEAKVLETQREINLLLSERSNSSEGNSNKENIPAGCELKGEQLKVTFLSIEKLDEMAAANKTRMDEHGFEITAMEHRFANFDLHLIPQCEAHELINVLTPQNFDIPIFAFTEGTGNQDLLLLGMRRTGAHLTTFKGHFLGDFYSSINALERYGAYFLHHFLLQSIKCRCRFDLLRESLLVDKAGSNNNNGVNNTGNFIPAKFVVEAEWTLECSRKDVLMMSKKKLQMNNYLVEPPNEAIVELKFTPGWMDARIELTDRIKELRYLADLASKLKAGILPWDNDKLTADQSKFIIDRLKDLIISAKNKLESQSIFPFDFTDRLWDVLKIAKSVNTLRSAFQIIYDELQTGEFLVLVEANKVSSLAKMLRQRNIDEIIFPRLEPMTCLQFLCEIGVDRFYAELSYCFVNGDHLPITFDLSPYLLRSMASIESKIERLLPLYLALQSMIVIDNYTRLQQHEKTNMAKRLLEHFISLKGTEPFEKEFVFKATMGDTVRDKIDSQAMCDWILERTYNKYTNQYTECSSGPILDAVHISKHFGIKYLHTKPVAQHDGVSEKVIKIKQEIASPAQQNVTTVVPDDGDVKKKLENVDDISVDEQKYYECLYLTSTSQPVSLFVV